MADEPLKHYGGTLVLVDPGNPRARKPEKRLVRFMGTTETVDAHGSIIKADGLDFARYLRNPAVLLDHLNAVRAIAGRAAEIEKIQTPVRGYSIGVDFASHESPDAAQAERLARAGFLRGMSMGFIPKKERFGDQISNAERELLGLPRNGFIVEEAEVLEFSLVAIPSNPDALQRALATRAITEEDAAALMADEGSDDAGASGEHDLAMVRNLLERLVLGQSEAAEALDDAVTAIREETERGMQAVVAAIARLEGKLSDGKDSEREARVLEAARAVIERARSRVALRGENGGRVTHHNRKG